MSSAQLYDTIGAAYTVTRCTEPRIAEQIWAALGDARTVLKVGAGTGSYELPFEDQSFDAVMAIAAVHHWQDPIAGVREMRHVACRVVVFTHDTGDTRWRRRFWLTRNYLPQVADLLVGRPSLTERARAIGARTEPVLILWDCADGFFEAHWRRRPEAYLDESVRRGVLVWARVGPATEQRAVYSLRDDLTSGRWAERNRDLLGLEAAELGLRPLIGAEPATPGTTSPRAATGVLRYHHKDSSQRGQRQQAAGAGQRCRCPARSEQSAHDVPVA
jgi:Methyltransferase domain